MNESKSLMNLKKEDALKITLEQMAMNRSNFNIKEYHKLLSNQVTALMFDGV